MSEQTIKDVKAEFPQIKLTTDDFNVEFEILNVKNQSKYQKEIDEIDSKLNANQIKLDELDLEIERLTNHADGLDYAIAVISGIISGLIDSFFVGKTEIDIKKVQEFLEEKYHTANDSSYRHKDDDGHWISSALYHRLDDLAHHPTMGGLIASILVRYFRLVFFVDGSDGKPHIFFDDTSSPDVLKEEKEKQVKAIIGAVIGGLCFWLANVAIEKYEEKNDENLPEPLKKLIKIIGAAPLIIEILKCVDIWLGHMMSDVSTSQGIPGIMLSLMKEISVLPILRNTDFRVKVDGYYNKGEKTLAEWGGIVFVAIKNQSLPVIINEAIVRLFYFIRRLVAELKENKDIKSIDWDNVIPIKNRTIVRMITIASGTFTAVDLIDAAIRGIVEGGGNPAIIAKNIVLRVNFVGVGRFVLAVGSDVKMGVDKNRATNERIKIYNEQIKLTNAKVAYKQADVWVEAESTGKTIEELALVAEQSIQYFAESMQAIDDSFEEIDTYIDGVKTHNSELVDEMLDVLKWG